MSLELILNFSATNDLTVRFEGEDSEPMRFESPLGDEELQEVRWYLECYSSAYMADVDDARADRIAVKLPMWGKLLFEAAFRERSASRLFDQFLDSSEPGRVLTVQAVLRRFWRCLGSCCISRGVLICLMRNHVFRCGGICRGFGGGARLSSSRRRRRCGC